MKRYKSLVAVCAVAISGAMPLSAGAQDVRDLHVMNAGGSFGDALEACVNEQLLESHGIRVITETPGGYAKMQAQARSGVITNTVSDGSTADLFRMTAEGLLEEINWDQLNPDPMFDEAMHQYGFGAQYYSTIMAWRDDVPQPASFREFFDVENFPGVRALPDYPGFVLPFAALGGGQSVEDVSNGVDLDLAFETLNRIKDHVIWWQSGAQPAQLLQDGEAQYAIAWNGRVIDQEGVSYSFNEGMLDISYWMVADGISDEQREMLYEWMRIQSTAEAQACLVEYLPYPGPSPDLAALVTEEQAVNFPTHPDNKAVQWLVPGQWWFDNAAEVEARWNEFKLLQ
ncbi:MAG: extracellular solute-binding protein [Alphaproteobacteria bacterium]